MQPRPSAGNDVGNGDSKSFAHRTVSRSVQAAVRDITLLQKNGDWELHAKTGSVMAADPHIGWWVGWVLKDGKVYSFALNIDTRQALDTNARIALGKASLKALASWIDAKDRDPRPFVLRRFGLNRARTACRSCLENLPK